MRQLYQEVILDHNRKPRNFGAIPGANRHADGHNPLCGDHIKLSMNVLDDKIESHRIRRAGLRDLQGICLDDDERGQGQNRAGSGDRWSRNSAAWRPARSIRKTRPTIWAS